MSRDRDWRNNMVVLYGGPMMGSPRTPQGNERRPVLPVPPSDIRRFLGPGQKMRMSVSVDGDGVLHVLLSANGAVIGEVSGLPPLAIDLEV